MKWLDKNQEKILFFTWCFIILTSLLVIFTSPVKAESPNLDDYDLPLTIGIPEQLSDLGIDSNIVNSVRSQYFSILAGYGNDVSSSYTIFVEQIDSQNLIYITATNLLEITNSSVVTTDYLLSYRNLGQHFVQFTYNSNSGVLSSGNFYGGWVAEWKPFSKQTMAIGKGWILDSAVEFPNYWVFPSEVPDITGHASPPVDDSGLYIEDDNGNRIPKPNKPTPTPYTPPVIQFPIIDTSSLESLVQSLIDLVQYFISYIGGVVNGWFSNLLSNLDSWFDYVVQSFNYAVNNIVGAIKDLVQTFYNNMVSLFEPLYEFFNGVATFFNNLIQLGMDGDSFSLSTFIYNFLVPDPEDFAQSLIDLDIHHVVPLARIVKTKFVSIFDSFYNLTPTKVFLLPSFTWHGHTYNLTMDFSWYDDYKVYGDTIITGFLVIGYIYWFVLQLNSMFRGGSSIGHDVAKVGGKE